MAKWLTDDIYVSYLDNIPVPIALGRAGSRPNKFPALPRAHLQPPSVLVDRIIPYAKQWKGVVKEAAEVLESVQNKEEIYIEVEDTKTKQPMTI